MNPTEQVSWERRCAPAAAAAALGAVVLQVAGVVLQAPVQQDAPGSDDPDRHIESLLNVEEHFGSLLASVVVQGLSVACAAFALYYLWRATRARRSELPSVLRYLLVIAPILILIGGVLDRMDIKDVADRFTSEPALSAPTPQSIRQATRVCEERRARDVNRCVEIEREDQAAEDFIEDERSFVGASLALASGLAMGFAFVLISLHAMRAGLLSRFMGILGIIAGVLQVLPLSPIPIVQTFWLGALVALFLNRWPGGRGPAWESGEADPWPSMASLREESVGGAVRRQFEPEDEVEPTADTPEPAEPEHPVSKRRKRKRRR